MNLIYDNIIFDIQQFGGISVVWQELLRRVQFHGSVRYIDVDTSQVKNHYREQLDIASADVTSTISCPKISRYFPVRLSSKEPFLFHSSYYRYCTSKNAINITTVHDFTYELFRHGLRQKVHTWQKCAAIRHSAAVVCISENTKRDLLRLMPDVDEKRVRVIYNGVSEVYRVLGMDELQAEELPFPSGTYLVFIGRRDEYKNFELVARTVAATSWNLLIVGGKLNEAEKKMMDELMPESRYRHLSHISDELLNYYYNHAAALVYPSAYEGFGLPVLEAQRANCPVIAYDASSIPEVIGETPLLMQSLTERELTEKLALLTDGQLMKKVRAEGLDNVQRFGWDIMARQYQGLYEEFRGTCSS